VLTGTEQTSAETPRIGFIGVGGMGGPMAKNLLTAGYSVRAYDRMPERMETIMAAGAEAAADEEDAIRDRDVICLSLPSSDACVSVADSILIPLVRPGQILVDFGTTTPPETRRIAAAIAEKGAYWFEAPVSGGIGGAEKARLRTFAGGDPEIFARLRPILETIGGADGLYYCGATGSGQVVKGVNQLAMGLGAAAYLEAVAFGVRAGVAPEVIAGAVGSESERWRAMVLQMARAAHEGRAEQMGVKFRELPYFLREAAESGFVLPLTETLYNFCDAGERVVVDDNRPAPSFWHELMREPPNVGSGEG
jgi:3-hydroxyisobutyrate dehydrogenase-like beta-hydroxyacid dehydrogenase